MTTAAAPPAPRPLPPVLDRMVRGTSWLVLRTVLQAVFVFWSVPLILHAIGPEANGAYNFAWGFGFLQFLLEFGMGSALQRQLSERWAQGDREGVDRAVACGLVFQGAMALVQAVAFVGIAVYLLPHAGYRGASYRLIVQLLWLQALTAPGTALATVVSGVLQAARRYEVLPRAEVAIVTVRFLVLVAGLRLGVDFFAIVAVQTVLGLGLLLGPALWGVLRDLGYVPRLGRIRPADFAPLFRTSVYVFLIQLSVVLADKADTTVLGFALADPGPATSVYQVVSKPFLQVRQTGWMLSYLVMPAAASLAAARDRAGLDRLAYDGPRLIVGLLLPVALLAGIYAAPFLSLWVGPAYAGEARWLRLFLVADLPLVLTVHVQMAIAAGRIRPIAVASLLGGLVNLPLSYYLTLRLGVGGVIWGTVLTTLVANLVVPGLYVIRVLGLNPGALLTRTLGAPACGALALVAASGALRAVLSPDPRGVTALARSLPLLAHLAAGCLAFLAGYAAVPAGRGDVAAVARTVRRRLAGA